MKKIMELIKPFLSLVFGILLILYYLNFLNAQEGVILALGIIGVVIASYYIAVGILGIVLGAKMPAKLKEVFDIISVSAFPGFMFVFYLFRVINTQGMGPSGWIIYISCMAASISLCVVYIISRFVKNDVMVRLSSLFGLIFVLALICDLLFDVQGNSQVLGMIEVVPVLIYLCYISILFKSLGKEKKAE